jgi:hypothetical protein
VPPTEGDYTRALSLSRLAYDLENLLSPALAAALLAVISFNALFAGTVIGFLFSALLVLSVQLPWVNPFATKSHAAFAYIWRRLACADCSASTWLQSPALRLAAPPGRALNSLPIRVHSKIMLLPSLLIDGSRTKATLHRVEHEVILRHLALLDPFQTGVATYLSRRPAGG